jgi:hypothetical protein
MVDVTGIEPVTPCLQSRAGKTLTALSGVAYTKISEIFVLSNVPKLYLWLAKILLGFEIKSLWRFLSSRWDVMPERCSISCGSVWAPLPVCFALVAASY